MTTYRVSVSLRLSEVQAVRLITRLRDTDHRALATVGGPYPTDRDRWTIHLHIQRPSPVAAIYGALELFRLAELERVVSNTSLLGVPGGLDITVRDDQPDDLAKEQASMGAEVSRRLVDGRRCNCGETGITMTQGGDW